MTRFVIKRFLWFVPTLLAFVGEDIDRHYWSGTYLYAADYLQGNPPLPQLALALMHDGLFLCRLSWRHNDEYHVVTLHTVAAVLCKRAGLDALAIEHKKAFQMLLADKPILAGGSPALSDDDNAVYNSIRVEATKPKKVYNEEKLRTDQDELLKFYRNNGFVDVAVSTPASLTPPALPGPRAPRPGC